MSANPTDHEILLEAIRSQLARVNTSLPGVVVSYSEANQTATVRPSFRFAYRDAEGVLQRYDPPAIHNVPVAFPGGGSFSITWPLAEGDSVLLVFSSRSLDEWRTVAGAAHEPKDLRRFDLSDAVAVPGLRSPADPIPAAGRAAGAMVLRAADLRLGSATASDSVALASLVEAEINALWTAIGAHMHAGVTVGSGVTGTATYPGSSGSVGASKVKAE